MSCSLHNPRVTQVLDALYADAEHRESCRNNDTQTANAPAKNSSPYERFYALKDHYLPIDMPFGNLLYALIRTSRPHTVIEFGTSFGISTIFLAAAVHDNGVGRVITTEFIEEKADVAKCNLTDAGLAECVEFRVGDALDTLKDPLPAPCDFLFLDGEKSLYRDVVILLEPQMKSGCLIVSDNTDHEGAQTYLEHVRDAHNGYVSTPLLTLGGTKHETGHELSVRV